MKGQRRNAQPQSAQTGAPARLTIVVITFPRDSHLSLVRGLLMGRVKKNLLRPTWMAIALISLQAVISQAKSPWPEPVELALKEAGKNRGELEKVLEHYQKA